jgi:RND family efflux transporter MFP subunit
MMNFLKWIFMFSLLIACKHKSDSPQESDRISLQETLPLVEVMLLTRSAFIQELVSNGKLIALRKSDLQFGLTAEIAMVAVENGDRVSKGQLLATLKDDLYRQQLQQSEANLEQARFAMQDVLIGLGYNLSDSSMVPANKLELAGIKSGYAAALAAYETALSNMEACSLRAPFSGIVAGINQKAYERPNSGPFCTLIDDSRFEVAFQVLETELAAVRSASTVRIAPFFQETVEARGKITSINPVVDKNGLVLVKALVDNPGSLLEGMNVKVYIERKLPGQFVVPKSAVVLRDNFEVLFKVMDGKAYWTYVKTILENSDSYSVIPNPDKESATLEIGDTIIISGNLNLAHESDVKIN